MFRALYRKWRPLQFVDVIGQNHITSTLKNQIKTDRASHAYIFTGTRGTGKTSCAKILARAVNCKNPQNGDPCNECDACINILDDNGMDVLEIDAASNNGVDNIRDVRDETRYTPVNLKKRVYIIDEVHMLSTGAFNALLKTLEEPPSHVLFILATTEIHKVPATILSRCQRFDFRRISSHEIAIKLTEIARKEDIKITDEAIVLISRLCDGGMRDALSILDRCSADREILIDEEVVASSVGILSANSVLELITNIADKDSAKAIGTLAELYNSGREISSVFEQLLSVFRDILLVKTSKSDVSGLINPSYTAKTLEKFEIDPSRAVSICDTILKSLANMSRSADKHIEADMCMIRICSDVELLSPTVQTVVQTKIVHAPSTNTGEVQTPIQSTLVEPEPIVQKQDFTKGVEFNADIWGRILKGLTGQINIAALTNLKISSKMTVTGDNMVIVADDFITASLANEASVKMTIQKCASEIIGHMVKVTIIEEEKITKDTFKASEAVERALDNAKELGIELEEIN